MSSYEQVKLWSHLERVSLPLLLGLTHDHPLKCNRADRLLKYNHDFMITALYTVMCYNVLCDKYCTRQLYGYCPSWALNWEYRKKGIIEEVRHYSADIITLQACSRFLLSIETYFV